VRRIIVALMGTISSIALLLAYPTSHDASASSTAAVGAGAAGPGTSGSSPGTSSPGTSSSGSSATTYTGAAADTRWGVVQVRITVESGRITASEAVRYPNDNGHDQEVNAYALPILAQEVVAAQSASIDAVSGATVTSNGYVESLQSALDAAHLP